MPQTRKGVIGRADLLRISALGVQHTLRLNDYYFYLDEPEKKDTATEALNFAQPAVPDSQVSTHLTSTRPKLAHLWLVAEREPRARSEVADTPTPTLIAQVQEAKPDPASVFSAIAQAQGDGVYTLARRLATRVRARFFCQVDGSLDLAALSERFARAQSLAPAPRQALRVAHAPLVVVLDLSESMRPLHGPLKLLATGLRRELGLAVLEPSCFDVFGKHPAALDGGAALLLSDGRCESVRAWLAQAPKAARLCVSPVPMQALPHGVLQLSLARVPEIALAEFIGFLRLVPNCQAELLLPLACFWCQGAEAWALAWAVWNHPSVQRNREQCWLAPPDAAQTHAAEAQALPRVHALLALYLALHALEAEGDRAMARLYAASVPGLETELAPHRYAAEAYVEHLREQMQAGSEDAALLAAAFVRALPAAQRAQARYAQVFQLAHRTLGRRTDEQLWIPDGLQLSSEDAVAEPEPWRLRHINDALVLERVSAGNAELLLQTSLAVLQLASGQWLQWRFNGKAKAACVAGDCIVLVDFFTETTNEIELLTANERLQLTRVPKPSWASSWGRDQDGLWAQSPKLGALSARFRQVPDAKAATLFLPSEGEQRAEPVGPLCLGLDRFGAFVDLTVKKVTQRLRWIEPGAFWMGSTETEEERYDNEGPRHRVTLTQGFWLADTACTQAFWMAVVGGKSPSRFAEDAENPVEHVSWDDITQQFLPVLQSLLGDAVKVELPSEAQWEYAGRAGTETAYNFGDQIDETMANFGHRVGKTVPVTHFAANPWGLMQMHGNVWEWCRDGRREYSDEAVVDPEGPSDALRALRGGSWIRGAQNVRSACRLANTPGNRVDNVGFRFSLRSMSPVQLKRPEGAKEKAMRPEGAQRRGGAPASAAERPSKKMGAT